MKKENSSALRLQCSYFQSIIKSSKSLLLWKNDGKKTTDSVDVCKLEKGMSEILEMLGKVTSKNERVLFTFHGMCLKMLVKNH